MAISLSLPSVMICAIQMLLSRLQTTRNLGVNGMSPGPASTGRRIPPARTGNGLVAALLSLSALALLAGCGGSSAKPVAQLPPNQIVTEALAAARSKGSVHVDVSAAASQAVVRIVGVASPTVGRQVARGNDGAVMTELVRPGSTYVRGNAAGLTGFLGMSAKTASQLANRWLVLHAGNPNYQSITQGVTADSILSSITPVGSLTKTKPEKVDRQSVVGVVGKAPSGSGMPLGATATLWVAASGKPLPVAAEEVSGSTRFEVLFLRSSWGQEVTGVSAPQGAVPYPAGLSSSSSGAGG